MGCGGEATIKCWIRSGKWNNCSHPNFADALFLLARRGMAQIDSILHRINSKYSQFYLSLVSKWSDKSDSCAYRSCIFEMMPLLGPQRDGASASDTTLLFSSFIISTENFNSVETFHIACCSQRKLAGRYIMATTLVGRDAFWFRMQCNVFSFSGHHGK